MTGVSPDRQTAAGHRPPGLNADIARDVDFASGHAGADLIEPVVGALDADLRSIARTQPERIANGDAYLRGLKLDPIDFRCALAREQMRNKRREIEPLLRTRAQGEHQRLHGSRSFRRIMMRAEFAAVVTRTDAHRTALRPELDDRGDPGAHRVRDRVRRQAVDHDFQHADTSSSSAVFTAPRSVGQ